MIHTYEKPWLEHVKGDTWCIVTSHVRIPLFRLDNGRAVLIDSGLAAPDGPEILSLLRREGLTAAAVLTSHTHIDHAGNHRLLQREHGARLWMSQLDAAAFSNAVALEALFADIGRRQAAERNAAMFCRADEIIWPEDTHVTVEGASFTVLRLPGHTLEHLGFVTPDGVAYLGDVLLSEQVLAAVRIPYCACCELDLWSKRAAAELPYDRYIIPHNGVCGDIRTLAQANIDAMLEKVELTAAQADRWLSMEELAARVAAATGVAGDSVYRVRIAKGNIRSFVKYLLDRGRLAQRAKDGVIQYIRADRAGLPPERKETEACPGIVK